MSIIQFFDDMEKNDFFMMCAAFIILFVPGFIIGFVMEGLDWIIIVAAIIAGIFVIWCSLYVYANWHEWRKEKEILAELPSFPHKDFCDICGKEVDEGERKTDGEFLIIVCPHCNAENIVSSEQKIQEVELTKEEENDTN